MATPSAALSIRPPADPLQQYGRLVSLKSLLQQQQLQQGQQQLQQQQIQSATTQNQMQQMQLQSQKAFMQAFAKPVDWNDPNAVQKVMDNAAQNGATPQSILAFHNALLDQRTKLASLNGDALKNHAAQNDQIRGTLMSIIGQPDQQAKQQAWTQAVQHYEGAGVIQPGQVSESYPGDATAQVLANHFALGSELAKEAAANRTAEARESQAKTAAGRLATELPGIQANNAIKGAEASAIKQTGGAYMPPDVMNSMYVNLVQKALGGHPLTSEEQNFLGAVKNLKTIVPKFNFNIQSGAMSQYLTPEQAKLNGQDFLKTVPAQDVGVLKALSEGRMALPSSFALRTPYWERMMAELNQYDPGFNEQRSQMRRSFLTGSTGQNVGNLNTAAVHLDTLGTLANALQNKDTRIINRMANAWATATGNAAPTNFEAVKTAVAGELANALKGTATDAEIANIERSVDKQNSPDQLAGFVKQQLGIVHQKLNTYQQRWLAQNPGDTTFSDSLVLPQARQVFQRHGIAENGNGGANEAPIAITAPNGQIFHFANQQQATAFKKAAGIQ